jgi:hypothetical protein
MGELGRVMYLHRWPVEHRLHRPPPPQSLPPPLPACSSCTSCSQVEYHFNRRALETNLAVLQELVALRAELASVSGLLPCVSVNASFSSHQPDEGEQGWCIHDEGGPRPAHQTDKPHRTMD